MQWWGFKYSEDKLLKRKMEAIEHNSSHILKVIIFLFYSNCIKTTLIYSHMYSQPIIYTHSFTKTNKLRSDFKSGIQLIGSSKNSNNYKHMHAF